MLEIFEIVAAILVSVGVSGAIIVSISKWLSGLIAKRLEQSYQARLDKAAADEFDLLIRRREVYSRLIKSMRVFLSSKVAATVEEENEFLRSYDECCLWAPDEVLAAIGEFLDLNIQKSKSQKSVDQNDYRKTYTNCIEKIRQDSGFKDTNIVYRFVNFS